MKLFEFIIKPLSGLGTPLKGDTLFGHFCWQAAYDENILDGGLEKWIAQYQDQPFAVFSSAWPVFDQSVGRYAFKRPDIPASELFMRLHGLDREGWLKQRKDLLNRQWMLVNEDLSLDLDSVELKSGADLADMVRKETGMDFPAVKEFQAAAAQSHNSINRLSFTTGKGFDPFDEVYTSFHPGARLAVFVLFDPRAVHQDGISLALERIGQWGYGRDASTGKGRFEVCGRREIPIPKAPGANACYALGPVVPEKNWCGEMHFSPFIRFGRHGDVLAWSKNPFKNPIIMADEGGVFIPKDKTAFERPYFGSACLGVSLTQPEAAAQGWALYLPFHHGEAHHDADQETAA